MLHTIRYIPLLVIFVFTVIQFCKQRRTEGAQDYRNLLVALASMGGYLFTETTHTISFMGFRFNELSVGFILVAIGALSCKRLWSLIGAVWFMLHSAALFLMGQGYSVVMGISAVVCLILTVMVFYQNKVHRALPMMLWIALLAVAVISRNRGVNITLLALLVWFSSQFEQWDKMLKIGTKTEKPAESAASVEDKLSALENLRELLDSGTISQEEFDAKKKEWLEL